MSVSYTAILSRGRRFGTVEEVVHFLRECDLITEEYEKLLLEHGYEYVTELDIHGKSIKCLSRHTGNDYYVGD